MEQNIIVHRIFMDISDINGGVTPLSTHVADSSEREILRYMTSTDQWTNGWISTFQLPLKITNFFCVGFISHDHMVMDGRKLSIESI